MTTIEKINYTIGRKPITLNYTYDGVATGQKSIAKRIFQSVDALSESLDDEEPAEL